MKGNVETEKENQKEEFRSFCVIDLNWNLVDPAAAAADREKDKLSTSRGIWVDWNGTVLAARALDKLQQEGDRPDGHRPPSSAVVDAIFWQQPPVTHVSWERLYMQANDGNGNQACFHGEIKLN